MTVRWGVLAVGLLSAALAGCADAAPPPAPPAPSPEVVTFASDNPGSVNAYWLSGPNGLVQVDALRTVSDARRALPAVQATGKPVAAIVLTHPHPDHVGGLGTFHQTYPAAPIYANAATADFMRTDPLHFYALTHEQLGEDHPALPTPPDRTLAANAPLDVAGLRLETAEFGAGESVTMVVYYHRDSGALFAGDLVGNRVTPALLEGHTCGWLTGLEELRGRFPDARTLYPGHGASGDPTALRDAQREYLKHFRRLVRPAIDPGSAAGTEVSPDEQRTIVAELDRAYPDYPRVASLPNIQELNIAAVAGELRAENPATLPGACTDT